MGQQITNRLTEEEKGKYKLMSHAQKADFRKRWCELHVGDFFVRVEKRESWTSVDFARGKYRSLNAVAKMEGGQPEDFAAAAKLAAKCVSMGYPWIRWNTFTERWDYLVFEHGVAEELSRSWHMFQTAQGQGGTPAATVHGVTGQTTAPNDGGAAGSGGESATVVPGNSAGVPTNSVTTTPTPTPSDDGREKHGRRPGGAAGGDGDNNPKKPKLPKPSKPSKPGKPIPGAGGVGAAVSAAAKMKAQYSATVSRANGILRCIERNAEWKWASTPGLRGDLQVNLNKLEGSLDTFGTAVLTMPMDYIKKEYADNLAATCQNFVAKLQPLVDAVDNETKKLTNMQAARNAS